MALMPIDRGAIGAHEGIPGARRLLIGAGHIGVVIARDDRDVGRIAGLLEPAGHRRDLQRRGEVHQVSGDRHMVGIALLDIGHQAVERAREQVPAAVPVPVDEAGDALGGKFPQGEIGQGAEMDIGDMGKFEHRPRLAHIPDEGNQVAGLIRFDGEFGRIGI
ncbi:hypothetical protein D3C71_1621980 [compost metagenome]